MRSFYTQKFLYREVFTQRSFHTQKLLHIFFTREFLHPGTLTHNFLYAHSSVHIDFFYTKKFLHTKALARRSLYTKELLHTEVFTQRSLYTGELLRTAAIYTEKSLHRGALETLLHRGALLQSSFVTLQNLNSTSVLDV